ncbi:MAG: hypothetical protein GYA14_05835 [Ignavibacteria bacterium]|nr:hypothetical protein [Ignavibacteria bacterium]
MGKNENVEKVEEKIEPNQEKDKKFKESKQEDLSPEAVEFMESMPERMRSSVFAMLQSSSSESFHPLFKKFDGTHIHKFLDYLQEDDRNNFNLRKSSRIFQTIYFFAFLAFITFLIVYLVPINMELLVDILKVGLAFGAGLGSGYGLRSYQSKKK